MRRKGELRCVSLASRLRLSLLSRPSDPNSMLSRAGVNGQNQTTHLVGAQQLDDPGAMLHSGLERCLSDELLQRPFARRFRPTLGHGLDGDLLAGLAVDGEVDDAVGAVGWGKKKEGKTGSDPQTTEREKKGR